MARLVFRNQGRANEEQLAEIITAVTHMRYQNDEKPNVTLDINSGVFSIDGSEITVEMMDVISEYKEILQLEDVHFEASTDTEPREGWHSRGRIYDNAIGSLYFDIPHDRRKTA